MKSFIIFLVWILFWAVGAGMGIVCGYLVTCHTNPQFARQLERMIGS